MSRIGKLFACAASVAAILSAALPADAGHYSAAVLLDNPVAYYRLNEMSGTTAFNSGTGTGINGNYVNIPGPGMSTANFSNYGEQGPRPTAFPGFEADNNSVLFDPSNGTAATSTTFPAVEVPVADASNPLVITGPLTLEAWIKRSAVNAVAGTGVNDNEGIVGRYVGAGNLRSYVLYYDPHTDGANGGFANGNPGFGVALSSNGMNQATTSYEFGVPTARVDELAPGKWVHVAAVFEPSTRVEVYVNGVSIGKITPTSPGAPTAVPSALSNTLAPLWIGQQFSGANIWTYEGNIDEVAIYAEALDDDQIKAHYDAAFIPEPMTWQLAFVAGIALLFRLRRRG